jgi:hypothetical protein
MHLGLHAHRPTIFPVYLYDYKTWCISLCLSEFIITTGRVKSPCELLEVALNGLPPQAFFVQGVKQSLNWQMGQ